MGTRPKLNINKTFLRSPRGHINIVCTRPIKVVCPLECRNVIKLLNGEHVIYLNLLLKLLIMIDGFFYEIENRPSHQDLRLGKTGLTCLFSFVVCVSASNMLEQRLENVMTL